MKRTHLFFAIACLTIIIGTPMMAFGQTDNSNESLSQGWSAQSALARLEARRQSRLNEAEKHHLILPSQRSKSEAVVEPSEPVLLPPPSSNAVLTINPAQPEEILLPLEPAVQNPHYKPLPVSLPPAQIEKNPSANPEVVIISGDSSPLGQLLARFELKRQKREQEAAKLGIILPSQSGSLEGISPSLAKLNSTLVGLLQRTQFRN